MKALLLYGTRYGWTRKTIEVIGSELSSRGYEVSIYKKKTPRDVQPAEFDLVVVGSSIAMGMWKSGPKNFLKKFGPKIRNLALFLTAAGKLNNAQKEGIDPDQAVELVRQEYAQAFLSKNGLSPKYFSAFGGQFGSGDHISFNNWNKDDILAWTKKLTS